MPIAAARWSAATAMADSLPDRLQRALAARQPHVVTEWQARPAAVLVPLFWEAGEWHLLFTQRTEAVDTHRGQVSFPGGAIENTDGTPLAAALREAEEEIGLPSNLTRVLGQLDPLLTVTQFLVTPIVARIEWPFPIVLNRQEVAETFGVPLAFLSDSKNLQLESREPLIPGRPVQVYSFLPYHDHVIWGVTARITIDLLSLLQGL